MSTKHKNNFVSNSNIFLQVFCSPSSLVYNTSSIFLSNNFHNLYVRFTSCFAYSFTIEAGTPLVQIFPFKREEWASTYYYQDAEAWHGQHAIHPDSMQKWQRELKLVDDETGLPNDQLNIGGYRSAKIWKPKSRLYGKPTDGGETPPPECPAHQSFKDKQRELTDLN